MKIDTMWCDVSYLQNKEKLLETFSQLKLAFVFSCFSSKRSGFQKFDQLWEGITWIELGGYNLTDKYNDLG